eukprot:TRINITY_DN22198_c0_g1_i1.p1 TRINITY_DN22198_c0_g1~~TRINITY_DN22198_c0_g1_i1.p1  ORF type:complete len:1005 (+),score=224.24 TRINITY_DN22198_c0_g1_i1:63-3077(+)
MSEPVVTEAISGKRNSASSAPETKDPHSTSTTTSSAVLASVDTQIPKVQSSSASPLPEKATSSPDTGTVTTGGPPVVVAKQEGATKTETLPPSAYVPNAKEVDDAISKLDWLLDRAGAFAQFIDDTEYTPSFGASGPAAPAQDAGSGEPPQKKRKGAEGAAAAAAEAPEQKPATAPVAEDESKPAAGQPLLAVGGRLRQYQIAAVQWLERLYMNGFNGILADEMGLGKTVTTVSFLCLLWANRIHGPFIVVAPVSTLQNWVNEVNKWTGGQIPAILYHGTKDHRASIQRDRLTRLIGAKRVKSKHGCVVVTSYDVAMHDLKFLRRIKWCYLVVDEAHRLKNMHCQLIIKLKTLPAEYRLLLTGTPLQNNLSELWSLLNFILPNIFDDLPQFKRWFAFEDIVNDDPPPSTTTREPPAVTADAAPTDGAPSGSPAEERAGGTSAGGGASCEAHCGVSEPATSPVDVLSPGPVPAGTEAPVATGADAAADGKPSGSHGASDPSPTVPAASPTAAAAAAAGDAPSGGAGEACSGSHGSPPVVAGDTGKEKAAKPLPHYARAPEAASRPRKALLQGEQHSKVLTKLHAILRPFVLRRLKREVGLSLPRKREIALYCSATPKQAEQLQKMARGAWTEGTALRRPQNLVMQLRKLCNHPLLFDELNPFVDVVTRVTHRSRMKSDDSDIDAAAGDRALRLPQVSEVVTKQYDAEDPEHRAAYMRALATGSGKMRLLVKMVRRLRADGHRVLIFSQMVSMLDLVEDYFDLAGYTYRRLDGSVPQAERQVRIEAFNADTSIFAFLVSTRAGGLGVNLTGADTVIIYDSDWNPQADLQAQDRAHRIGQTRPVAVYRLLTANSVESYLVHRANQKLRLEHLVIERGGFDRSRSAGRHLLSQEDLLEILNMRTGDGDVHVGAVGDDDEDAGIDDATLEKVLDRTQMLDMLLSSSRVGDSAEAEDADVEAAAEAERIIESGGDEKAALSALRDTSATLHDRSHRKQGFEIVVNEEEMI